MDFEKTVKTAEIGLIWKTVKSEQRSLKIGEFKENH